MGATNGGMMLRVLGVIAAAALVTTSRGRPADRMEGESAERASIDVSALLAAARGAPPLICSLAAQSLRGYGWGDWGDAPSTPLSAVLPAEAHDRDTESSQLPAADVDRLMQALSSDDPCVRELSVRLIGRQKNESVAPALIAKLGTGDPAMRSVAALGLGLVQPRSAVEPLIGILRDATPAVRANSAWALGRIDDGRALAPLIPLFRDDAPLVRGAAVVAVGRMDSTSSVPALIRVLQQDDAPEVRRVAAWALGQLESREAVDALAAALSRDADARVREMSAWALGNAEGGGTPALLNALRKDADDKVRETAAWALAQSRDRTSADALSAAAESDRSARVRGTAAWGMGQLRGDGGRAPAGLLHVLKDESDDARLKAAWALGQIGDSNTLPAIRDAMKAEKNGQVRKALVRALSRSGGRSEQSMSELLGSSDPQVREAAVRGLVGREAFNPWPWPWPRPRPFP